MFESQLAAAFFYDGISCNLTTWEQLPAALIRRRPGLGTGRKDRVAVPSILPALPHHDETQPLILTPTVFPLVQVNPPSQGQI